MLGVKQRAWNKTITPANVQLSLLPPLFCTAHLNEQDFRTVRKKLWDVRHKWYNIGIELDLRKADLDNLRKQYKNDFDVCLSEIITAWLKRTDPRPTWKALIEALKEPTVEEDALAEDLTTKYLR